MAWQDQGRQYHGWFGDGTSGGGIDPAKVPETVLHLAAARLSPIRRAELDSIMRKGFGDRLLPAMRIWAAASHLAPGDFQRLVVGTETPRSVGGYLQSLGRNLAEAMSPESTPGAAAAAVDAGAGQLATVLSATRPGSMNYDASGPARQANYAATNGMIPEPEPVATGTLPEIVVRPGDDGDAARGEPAPAAADVPSIVAGLVTMAEAVPAAALVRLLPVLLGGLAIATVVAVIADLLGRLAQAPAAGPASDDPHPALPPAPGLVPPEMPGGPAPDGNPVPPYPETPGEPGFSPGPPLPGNAPSPVPDGPQGPLISPMARPKPTPEELKRREAKLRAAGLPTEGDYRYVPPRTWTSSQPIPKVGKSGGYRDIDGNEWRRPTGILTDGKPSHWDVVDPKGGHLNITLDGRIHHGGS